MKVHKLSKILVTMISTLFLSNSMMTIQNLREIYAQMHHFLPSILKKRPHQKRRSRKTSKKWRRRKEKSTKNTSIL